MLEIKRLTSLSSDLLKYSLFITAIFGSALTLILYYGTNVNLVASASFSYIFVFLLSLSFYAYIKAKINQVVGRLLYIIELMEESEKTAEVPIPVPEETIDIIESVNETLQSLETKFAREVDELEEQLDIIADNISKAIEELSRSMEGYTNIELPKGLDPIGALGQVTDMVLKTYRRRIKELKEGLESIRKEVDEILNAIKQSEALNREDIDNLKRKIERLKYEEEKIENSLKFFKDI